MRSIDLIVAADWRSVLVAAYANDGDDGDGLTDFESAGMYSPGMVYVP